MQIELRNISFRYHKNKPLVIKDISLTFESGNIYVLNGNNGVGKTTLGKLILGLLRPTDGKILFDGQDMKKVTASKRAQKIGYIFQNPDLQFFAPTVYEELKFPYEITKTFTPELEKRINSILKSFKLEEYIGRSPLTLSVGEKQKLALATIIIREVEFLILDEPSSALDLSGIEFLAGFLKEFIKNGGGVIIISHDNDTLDYLSEAKNITIQNGIIITQD